MTAQDQLQRGQIVQTRGGAFVAEVIGFGKRTEYGEVTYRLRTFRRKVGRWAMPGIELSDRFGIDELVALGVTRTGDKGAKVRAGETV